MGGMAAGDRALVCIFPLPLPPFLHPLPDSTPHTSLTCTPPQRRRAMPEISSARVMILATHGFEQSELEVRQRRLREAGAQVDVVSPQRGQIRGWKDKDWGASVKVDKSLDEADAEDYDAIVLPGGQI